MNNLVAAISIFACLIPCQPGSAQMLFESCGLPSEPENVLKPRIIDGIDAEIASSPWMAYLHTSPDFVCAGTLINHWFVLTAAHCIGSDYVLKVRLGEHNRLTINDCAEGEAIEGCLPPAEEYDVDMTFKNSLYNRVTQSNDIALLRLARRVQLKVHIRPICLIMDPGMAEQAERLSWFTGTGWGKTRSGNTSPVLQTINLNRYDRSVCRDQFGITLAANQFCAGHPTGNLCNGDSGGPLGRKVKYQGARRFVQFGIASYTTGNCVGPSVYTGVVSHATWIVRVVKLYDLDDPAPTISMKNSEVRH